MNSLQDAGFPGRCHAQLVAAGEAAFTATPEIKGEVIDTSRP
jgi:hypothetical protein